MLLNLNFSTCLLELSLNLLGLLLGDTLLNGLGSTVNECLCIAQRQAGDILNGLDNLELSLTGVLQDNVERRLLGCSSLACASSGSSNSNSCSSGLNSVLLLEDSSQFAYLLNCQIYQFFTQLLYICHSCNSY